jgi:hypothetical protein
MLFDGVKNHYVTDFFKALFLKMWSLYLIWSASVLSAD